MFSTLDDPTALPLLALLRRRAEWSRADLLALLRAENPQLSLATLSWRIHNLKIRGLLHARRRGYYAAMSPALPEFEPRLDSGNRRLLRFAQRALPAATPATICLTDTAWLNYLRPHDPALPSYRLLEVPKAHLPALYDALLELSRFVFLAPPPADVLRYLLLHERAVVLRPLPSEAPLLTLPDGLTTSTLEKLLVDALAHADLFDHYQPHLAALFQHAAQHYALNISRLRRYARRRNLLSAVEPLLPQNAH